MAEPIVIRMADVNDARALALLSASVQALHFAERPDVFKPVDTDALEAERAP